MPKEWNTFTFFQELSVLEKMVEQEKDPIRKDYLQMVLDDSTRFYYENFLSTFKNRVSLKKAMDNLACSVLSGDRYYTMVEKYFYSLTDAITKASIPDTLLNARMKDNFDLSSLTRTETTHNQAISSLFNLYRGLDDELFETFRCAFDKSYLNFNSRHDVTLPLGSDGRTYFIDGVQRNFVSIIDSQDVRLVNNLVHEYGHAIKNIICPEAAFTCENDYFSEVASIFLELISFEENPGEYPQLIMDYLKYDTFREYYDYSFTLSAQPHIYLRWKDNDFKTNHRFRKGLVKEDKIDKKIFVKALETDIADSGAYVLSYITALELLHIYREDKKEALKLFKKLLQLKPSMTYLGEVNSIVPLNVYATQETEKIVEDITLSLKRGSK